MSKRVKCHMQMSATKLTGASLHRKILSYSFFVFDYPPTGKNSYLKKRVLLLRRSFRMESAA